MTLSPERPFGEPVITFTTEISCGLRSDRQRESLQLRHHLPMGHGPYLADHLAQELLGSWQKLCSNCYDRDTCTYRHTNPVQQRDDEYAHAMKNFELSKVMDMGTGEAEYPKTELEILNSRKMEALQAEDLLEVGAICHRIGFLAGQTSERARCVKLKKKS